MRSSEQVERGLYGVLIVEDAEPAPYARDVVWVLDDWLLDEQRQIFPEFNTRARPDARRTLGQRHHRQRAHGDAAGACAPASGCGCACVNTANGRVFVPDFGALDVKIIAVDGLYLRAADPLPRLRARAREPARPRRHVRRRRRAACSPVVDRFYPQQPNPLADIVVDGDRAAPSRRFASPAHAHVPAWREALALPVTKQFRLNARRGGEHGIEWTINEQAFAGHAHAAPPALTMRQGTFQRLQFINESYRLHPIHLHGMFFRLLARNGAPVDEPFFRDTVLVHSRETIDIGLVPEDPGRWMMHCHILEHAEAGMMTTLEVRAPG